MILNVAANFYLTWRCNLQCTHCQYSCHPKETMEMTDEQLTVAFEILAVIGKSINSKISVIGVSGGEPTLHTKFWSVINTINGFKQRLSNSFALELHTNGTQPINDEIINKYPHVFDSAFVGCDAHHDFQKQNIRWRDLSMVAKQVVIRRAMLQSDTSSSWLRMIGRAKENYINDGTNIPQHHCTLAPSNTQGLLCFTPDRIKFCTEIGRNEYSEFNSIEYPNVHSIDEYTVKNLLLKSLEYSIFRSGQQCNTPCMYKLVRI